MDRQELHLLDNNQVSHSSAAGRSSIGNTCSGDKAGKPGWMLLAEDICFSGGRKVVLIAVLLPREQRVRWFYSLLPIVSLLQILHKHNLLGVSKEFLPATPRHARFLSYMREAFLAAVDIPHSPDYINAEGITDYCPGILDPDTALRRLEMNEVLYFAHKNPLDAGLDISEDRYLLYLHPAESNIASMAHLKCAEYMLVKRNFFKAFFEDIYRSDKKLDNAANASSTRTGGGGATATTAVAATGRVRFAEPATPSRAQTPISDTSTPAQRADFQTPARGGARVKVRTEHAHRTWLEKVYDMRSQRAKLMIVAWKELGFLDERRYMDWVNAGGMLEEIGLLGEESDGE